LPDVADELDLLRFDELGKQTDLGVNLWQSLQLAAQRGDAPAARVLCAQIRILTRSTFAVVKRLGEAEPDDARA
jgi:hypothetical protein